MATTKKRTTKKKATNYQTGRSKTSADKKRKALHPGKRISVNGVTYYEHRRNRSDKNRSTKL